MCLSWSRQLIEPCVISFLISHIRIRVKCQPYSIAKTISFFVCFLFCFLVHHINNVAKLLPISIKKKKISVCGSFVMMFWVCNATWLTHLLHLVATPLSMNLALSNCSWTLWRILSKGAEGMLW